MIKETITLKRIDELVKQARLEGSTHKFLVSLKDLGYIRGQVSSYHNKQLPAGEAGFKVLTTRGRADRDGYAEACIVKPLPDGRGYDENTLNLIKVSKEAGAYNANNRIKRARWVEIRNTYREEMGRLQALIIYDGDEGLL